jgi:hypothetical protein
MLNKEEGPLGAWLGDDYWPNMFGQRLVIFENP